VPFKFLSKVPFLNTSFQSVVQSVVQSAVQSAFESDIVIAVESVAQSAVQNVVQSAFQSAVQSAARNAVQSAAQLAPCSEIVSFKARSLGLSPQRLSSQLKFSNSRGRSSPSPVLKSGRGGPPLEGPLVFAS